ncbi:DNA methyltransferase [Agrobacterium sp. LR_9]|uniref:DNA methyltransferase n=1 Tax=Agrobacterium sp. LR_9 TaxID=3055787 RepID=UPI0035C0A7C1
MRHRFHAICPYFAMFPETFVEKYLVFSKPGDLVFDPFSGRGTTGFQSLLSGRRAISSDLSAVAACISRAKMQAPPQRDIVMRLAELSDGFCEVDDAAHDDEFYKACFAHHTLRQLTYLRATLNWQNDIRDGFIAALILGRLHGESHKSSRYFSNRMPRTIATKPDYSVRWWSKYGYVAPERDVFQILKTEISYRFDTGRPEAVGEVVQADARQANGAFAHYKNEVKLVITSPPYLDTTHFAEDQWLRNWFLGGQARARKMPRGDDRHTSKAQYWKFLGEAWGGMKELLARESVVVVRIGGSKIDFEEAKNGVLNSLAAGLERDVSLRSASESEIIGGQLRSFRPSAAGTKREYDIVVNVN